MRLIYQLHLNPVDRSLRSVAFLLASPSVQLNLMQGLEAHSTQVLLLDRMNYSHR